MKILRGRYRKEHDRPARLWLQLDDADIASFGEWVSNERRSRLTAELGRRGIEAPWRNASAIGVSRGELTFAEAVATITAYPDLAIEVALASTNPLTRALAVVDRRCGKRRLRALPVDGAEPSFLRVLLDARLEVEGLGPSRAPSNER